MNEVMLTNWNKMVMPNDIVYFLGDMCFGRGSRKPRWWLDQLNGRIVYIRGSHDLGTSTISAAPNVLRVVNSEIITVNTLVFLLVHDVSDPTVNGWDNWIIHGHSHDKRPFIDTAEKTVNVSVEVTGYKPVDMKYIIKTIEPNPRRG